MNFKLPSGNLLDSELAYEVYDCLERHWTSESIKEMAGLPLPKSRMKEGVAEYLKVLDLDEITRCRKENFAREVVFKIWCENISNAEVFWELYTLENVNGIIVETDGQRFGAIGKGDSIILSDNYDTVADISNLNKDGKIQFLYKKKPIEIKKIRVNKFNQLILTGC